ncbi:MAG TPA: hypothetical protein VGO21_00485 [Candidatus Paceibacterota bacterium]|nr:hypothetical protein [Candidatus Paceibacterota bacterium]
MELNSAKIGTQPVTRPPSVGQDAEYHADRGKWAEKPVDGITVYRNHDGSFWRAYQKNVGEVDLAGVNAVAQDRKKENRNRRVEYEQEGKVEVLYIDDVLYSREFKSGPIKTRTFYPTGEVMEERFSDGSYKQYFKDGTLVPSLQ